MGKDPPKSFKAPRFKAYLEHKEDKRIFVWTKKSWEDVKPHLGSPLLLDIVATPMASVNDDAIVIAATAQEISSTGAGIAIYRYDVADPKPYNVDRYAVWENLPNHYDFDQIVSAASTNVDDNLIKSLNDNVFLVQMKK